MKRPYFTDIEVLQTFLEDATLRCLFRINGICQTNCSARPYCEPWKNDLQDEKGLGEKG